MSRRTNLIDWFIRLPVLWGGITWALFYLFLRQGLINHPIVNRYVASHPVEYITVALFMVGLAALAIRGLSVLMEFSSVEGRLLSPIPAGGQPVSAASGLLEQLRHLSASLQETYLVRRVRDALEFVRRRDSAEALEDHLRHLEEADAADMHSGYSLVRIIVWAIPILGFLGTVIGITLAIANLDPEALENSLPEVTSGLGVAFDTTALALALSMVLMFCKYAVERMEDRLLTAVNARAAEEMVGRFQVAGTPTDPQVAAVRRMTEQVVVAVESLAARQVELWRASIDQTHEQWAQVTSAAGKVLEESFSTALDNNIARHAEVLNDGVKQHTDQLSQELQAALSQLNQGLERLGELLVDGLDKHGHALAASERDLAQENRRHLSEVEAALGEAMVVAADRQERLIGQSEELLRQMQATAADATQTAVQQQEQLIKQGEVLLHVVEASGQVQRLEDTLNHNLAALSRTNHLEEGMRNLAAAMQQLTARLGQSPQRPASAGYPPHDPRHHAA